MADPLSDPRAADLLAADCGEIATMLRVISTVHQQTDQCLTVLGRISSTPTWFGQAADAARSKIESVTPKLQQIGDGYGDAAQALETYYDVVSTVQPKFRALKTQIETSQAHLSTLANDQSSQQASLRGDLANVKSAVNPTAKAMQSMKSAVTSDQSDLITTNQQINNEQSNLSSLQGTGMTLLDHFSTARDTFTSKVSDISSTAPQESSWDKFLHGVEGVVGDGVGFIEHVGEGIYNSITSLPSDVDHLYHDPGDLSAWEKFGEDAAVTLSTAAVLTGFGAGLLGAVGVDGTIAGGVDATADALGTAGTVTTEANAGIEAAQGNYKKAAIDFIAAKFPDASNEAGTGEKAISASEDAEKGATAYAKALADNGDNPAAAYKSLSADEKAGLDSMGSVPLTATTANQYAQAAKSAVGIAKQRYNLTGRALDYSVDHVVKDPAKEHVETAVGAGGDDNGDDSGDDSTGDDSSTSDDGSTSGNRQPVGAAR